MGCNYDIRTVLEKDGIPAGCTALDVARLHNRTEVIKCIRYATAKSADDSEGPPSSYKTKYIILEVCVRHD